MLVPVKPTPSVWELAALKVKLAKAPGLITTLPDVPVLVPDVAVKVPVAVLPV